MDQIACPECTFLNDSTNTNCDICDTALKEDIQENPLEKEFMTLTGENRSTAQEYLQVASNNIDKAVSLFFQDKELGTTNSEFINRQHTNFVNSFFQLINSTLESSYQKPTNVEDLTTQLLFNRGRNKPHHCEICDSRAFLVCAKILCLVSNLSDIIRFIHCEDLDELKINEEKYAETTEEIFKIVQEKYIPTLVNNIIKYVEDAYINRQECSEKNMSIDEIEEIMNMRNGVNFRLIWDTIHESKEKLNNEEMTEILNNLVKSEEFHSYLNQSWEAPEYNHPASKKVISSLKKVKLTADCPELEELKESKCAICMSQFEQNDEKEVTMLGCHSFCTECITPWLENHNDTCPICRKKVGEV